MPSLVTKAEFARLIGRDRSWVTRMQQAGRLATEGEGRGMRIRVDESRVLISQTAGYRDDVASRHQESRHPAAQQNGQPATNAVPDAPAPQPPAESGAAGEARSQMAIEIEAARHAKVLAESRRVQAAADREEMERDKLAGDLIAREDVDAAMKFIGASIRGLLDVFPDQIAPIVAPIGTLEDCHAALTDACRNTLVQLGEVIDARRADLAKGTEASA